MASKKVVCSFDFEHDKRYYYLLQAWNSNPIIDFYISDCTPSEIQTESVSVIKQQLSWRIGDANYMVAIIGKHANSYHPNRYEIGYRNWQAYEIAKNKEKGNGLVVVFLDSSYTAPEEVYGGNVEFVYGFDLEKIKQALNKLAAKRW